MSYILAIDGGGTNTRVVITHGDGEILARFNYLGSNPNQDANSKKNLQKAIQEALKLAKINPSEIEVVVAGLAGLDNKSDLKWASEYLAIQGLDCHKIMVNDSRLAHEILFEGGSGIIAIAGTGCIVKGLNEENVEVCNYDFGHHAKTSSFQMILATLNKLELMPNVDEIKWVQAICKGLSQYSIMSVISWMREFNEEELKARNKALAELAPILTRAAEEGDELARSMIDSQLLELVDGIEMVAGKFMGDSIQLGVMGGVFNSDYCVESLTSMLGERLPQINLSKLTQEPVYGAISMGQKYLKQRKL